MPEWPSGITYRPIERWPGELTRNRRLSAFKAPLKSTLAQFRGEMSAIRGKNAVFQIALEEQQFRITDGAPRAAAIPAHPGIILSLETPNGALSFPCDTFTRWHDNLRAIVLTMEKLRAIDRYGVTKRGEQYTGWLQIEAGFAMPTRVNSTTEAFAILRKITGLDAAADPRKALRHAQRLTHPDTAADPEQAKEYAIVQAVEERMRMEGLL